MMMAACVLRQLIFLQSMIGWYINAGKSDEYQNIEGQYEGKYFHFVNLMAKIQKLSMQPDCKSVIQRNLHKFL